MQKDEDKDEQERMRHSSWKSSRKQAQAKERAKKHAGGSRFSSWGQYLGGLGEDMPQCGFILQTKAKRLEFACTSHFQAEKWIAAIQAAMSICTGESSKIRNTDVDSEHSTRSSSKTSNESSEVEDDRALPGPFCKVPAYTSMDPGRYFTAGSDLAAPLKSSGVIADLDSDANSTSFHVPRSSAGPRDWTAREATQRNVRFGPLLGSTVGENQVGMDSDQHLSTSIPWRDRLLACGKGPLPRDIKIP